MYARHMRRNPTEAEAVLWSLLRCRRLDGYRFRRQSIIFGWIADFYCPSQRVIVEVDGPYHQGEKIKRDMTRDRILLSKGFKTIRVTNEDVLHNPSQCLEKIRASMT
jgi:very-short-patch-repair endonuclease